MGKTSIDVSRANPDRVFAIIEADPDGGIYRSDDKGDSWQLVSDNWSARARAWYYIEIYTDPVDQETVYVLNAPMMKSIDGGRNFTNVSVPHGDTHDLWINPNDSDVMINANDGGANVSFNGGAILVHTAQSADCTVLSSERGQPIPLLRVRWPAGQQLRCDREQRRGWHHLEGLVSGGWMRERVYGVRSR